MFGRASVGRSCAYVRLALLLVSSFLLLLLVFGSSGCAGVVSGTVPKVNTPSGSPALAVTPSSVNFANAVVGSNNSQPIQVTDSGSGAVTITQITATGSGFSLGTLALPMTLTAAQSSTFNVQFSPASSGAASGSLSIASNAPNSPTIIPLTGSGVAATQTLSVSSTNLNFGNVSAGTSSSQNVTATNTGNSNVTISQIAVSGTGFTLSGAGTPVMLTPTQSFTFGVAFAPAAAGTFNGAVSIASNATGSPTTISLAGSGVTAVQHSVALNWSASPSPAATGYNVYRSSVSGSGYIKVNSSVVAGLSYTDNTVLAMQTYYYVATAVDANGDESPYSNELQMNVP
jgi:Abnormal spindle-like microcephaly-assoc'd, ASPM-SPD-2-Hydin